jgi:hypothetical protein
LRKNRAPTQQASEKEFVTPARPPWMAEVLETQEQFPVQAGVQNLKQTVSSTFWIPAFAGMTEYNVSSEFSAAC